MMIDGAAMIVLSIIVLLGMMDHNNTRSYVRRARTRRIVRGMLHATPPVMMMIRSSAYDIELYMHACILN